MRDFTYSIGCGCQVTIFAESDFRTSRTTCCERHAQRDMFDFRTKLVYEARNQREYAMQWEETNNHAR